MTDALAVLLDDTVAGTLSRLKGGKLRFSYEEEYRSRPDATPLSISMPLQIASHTDGVIAPWLWGLLPDNDAVLSRWSRDFQVSSSSPFSLLSTPIGEDCPGGVRFLAPDSVEQALGRAGQVTWLSEEEVAQRLRELKEDSTAWLGKTFTGQFSLGGSQAKTALLYEDGKWGVPSGTIPTSHILKPAVAGLDDHDLNEHLCLDAARRAGLTVARTRVAEFGDQSAIVVDRYDRHPVDGRLHRIHQEDLCQAMGVHPALKYQNVGGPGARDVVELFRHAMSGSSAEDAVRRFMDALIWNWIIAGTDAHAKNYALLLSVDQIRLAPLYDVASALPYQNERELRFAMKIVGDYRVFPYTNASWETTAREVGVDAEALVIRVRELISRAPDAFSEAAGTGAVTALGRDLPHRLVDLVADRAGRCAALLA